MRDSSFRFRSARLSESSTRRVSEMIVSTAGRQTNCHINALANAALVAGFELAIWFRET